MSNEILLLRKLFVAIAFRAVPIPCSGWFLFLGSMLVFLGIIGAWPLRSVATAFLAWSLSE